MYFVALASKYSPPSGGSPAQHKQGLYCSRHRNPSVFLFLTSFFPLPICVTVSYSYCSSLSLLLVLVLCVGVSVSNCPFCYASLYLLLLLYLILRSIMILYTLLNSCLRICVCHCPLFSGPSYTFSVSFIHSF